MDDDVAKWQCNQNWYQPIAPLTRFGEACPDAIVGVGEGVRAR